MHADTLYLSDKKLLPEHTFSGDRFDPNRLAYAAMTPFPSAAGSVTLPSRTLIAPQDDRL